MNKKDALIMHVSKIYKYGMQADIIFSDRKRKKCIVTKCKNLECGFSIRFENGVENCFCSRNIIGIDNVCFI